MAADAARPKGQSPLSATFCGESWNAPNVLNHPLMVLPSKRSLARPESASRLVSLPGHCHLLGARMELLEPGLT